MSLFAPAVKEKLKARVAIDGPTGSGKTWTALQWARILAGPDNPIGLVDTENRSAAYYAPEPGETPQRIKFYDSPYEFGHLPVSPPFNPIELVRIIDGAARELGPDGVLVIDSLTHYWSGEGGTLDIVDDASHRGNSFTGWKEGTPAQRAMLDAIIHAPCHVIVTMRSKMEYVLQEEVKNGRTITVPTKIGMKPEQRAGVEYEFTVVADMDLEHRLIVSKSRCDRIADVVAPKGRSWEPAVEFAEWLGRGVMRVTEDEGKLLIATLAHVKDDDEKASIRSAFLERFGRTAELTTEEYPVALAWMREQVTLTGVTLPETLVGPEGVPEPASEPTGDVGPASDDPGDEPGDAPDEEPPPVEDTPPPPDDGDAPDDAEATPTRQSIAARKRAEVEAEAAAIRERNDQLVDADASE